MKKTILVIIASLLLASPVWADQADKRSKHPIMKVLKQLELSDQQQQDIKQQLKTHRADRAVYREDGKQLKATLRDIIDADTWDTEAATETLLATADLKQGLLNSRALTHHTIWLLLTEEQQQKLNQITAERDGDNADNERRFRNKDKWDKIARRLSLSDEQATAIEAIRDDFELQQVTFKELRKAQKATEDEIIRTDTFDQIAWETLYAEHEQAMLEHAVARAYMQHQVLQVLTDEQRTKLQKLQRKMKNKQKRSKR